MSNDQTITTKPGNGALFHRRDLVDAKTKTELKARAKGDDTVPIVSLWTGDIVLPGNHRVQVQARYHERKNVFECTVREFDTWQLLGEFTMPGFAGQRYVDTTMKIENRAYKLRAITIVKTDPETDEEFMYIRLRLPQVTSVSRSHPAFR